LLGPSSNPTDQSGFANSAQDLFAVTVEPATKAAFVHFFLTSAKGNVVSVNDVNVRVAKLLSPPWKSDAKGFLRVETIQGRKGRALYDRFCERAFSDAHVLGHRWCDWQSNAGAVMIASSIEGKSSRLFEITFVLVCFNPLPTSLKRESRHHVSDSLLFGAWTRLVLRSADLRRSFFVV
jgi:hypothetical protein